MSTENLEEPEEWEEDLQHFLDQLRILLHDDDCGEEDER